MTVQKISAVTLAVGDMARSVVFYRDRIGLSMLYGGETKEFTSFGIGDGYLNLVHSLEPVSWWGRTIFYVDDVDALHARLVGWGLEPDTTPADAPWGERYFHVTDPDGHELSFARPLDDPAR